MKIRWAHQAAFPEIERLLADSAWFGDLNRFKAFQLGREAERHFPDDQKKLVVHETSHSFPYTDRARESLSWLDTHLGPVN